MTEPNPPNEPTTEADLDTTEEPSEVAEEPGVSTLKVVEFPSASQAKAARTYDLLTDLAVNVLTDDPACTSSALHQLTKEITDSVPEASFTASEAAWIKKLIDVLYEGVRLTEESSLGVDPPEEPEEPEPEDDRDILDTE